MPLTQSSYSLYLNEIRRSPFLESQEEHVLAKRWRVQRDHAAAHKLVTSHLRLVVKIAAGYRGYGFSMQELIAEGNVGLMQAIQRFDPDRGTRFSTYAILWIKARIQEYILHSWSLVKIGTTASQRKLFFNLRRATRKIFAHDDGDLHPEQVNLVAEELGVSQRDVVDMNRRLYGDFSLNVSMREGSEGEWQDLLVDSRATNQEVRAIESDEADHRHIALSQSLSVLNERERRIFEARRLTDKPVKLEALASEFGISSERVRQIDVRAFEKVRKGVTSRIASMQAQQVRERPTTLSNISTY